MRAATLFFFILELFSQSVIAQSPEWQVMPTICISDTQGDYCEMEIEVNLQNLPNGRYCLTLNELILACYISSEFPIRTKVEIKSSSELQLIDANQTIVLSTRLAVKSQQTYINRRRLRSPWSLF